MVSEACPEPGRRVEPSEIDTDALICWAGWASLNNPGPTPPQLPDIVTQAITVIGAAPATHFGALFGVSQFTSRNHPSPSIFQIHEWACRPAQRHTADTGAGDVIALAQVGAACLYFGSLVLALIFWALTGFSESCASVVRNMSYTLIGVTAGVIAVILNLRGA